MHLPFKLRSSGVVALCLTLAGAAWPLSAAEPVFRAGAVALDISPPKLPAIIAGGFLEGRGVKMTDPLHARCIVLDDGKTKIVFAIVDTCMMEQSLIDEAKQLASAQCGIPVDHMMVSATHTHSAPAAMGCLGTRQDKDYAAWLPGRIAEGIVQAVKNLQPARIGWASIDDWEHTHNRRWIRRPENKIVDPFGNATGQAHMHPGYLSADIIGPSGPVDPGLSVISLQTLEGKPLAVLANYSQHYFGSAPVSADYYGLFCKHVARLLGQEGDGNGAFVCALSQGTSGDLMWMDYGAAKKNITPDSYAEGVAKYAEEALKKVTYRDSVPLAMVEKKLPLDYRVPDEKRLEWARPIAAGIKDDLPKDKQEVYAREALILHERQKTEIKLQAIRIGDLSIATLPNEVYALTGLKLKAQSPSAAHFNIELANGSEGYIPTPEQHVLGGYTTWPARTAGLEVQAEPKIVETLLGSLEEATGGKRRVMQDDHGPYAEAVIGAKPAAYWRLNEAAGSVAHDAVSGGVEAKVSDGAAWYLPGVGSGTGTGKGEKLEPSAFSGAKQINRAVHLAGGNIQAKVDGMGDHYTVALWFWLGEASGASERAGTLVTGPGGETLGSQQFKDHRVQLGLGGAASTKSVMRADDWHFAVLVRDGNEVRVHMDGQETAELKRTLPVAKHEGRLVFGQGLQGKLDEIAVFNRALSPAEIGAFWKASGIAEQRARDVAERERIDKELAAQSMPPKFAAEYDKATAALKPVVHMLAGGPMSGLVIEPNVKLTPGAFAQFDAGRIAGKSEKLGSAYSISLWFRNRTPNDASPVTAYLFSRGPDGDKAAPGDHLGIGGTYRSGHSGRLMIFNGNAANQSVVGQTVIPPGTWNHAVLVRDGKRVRAYLNGVAKPEIDAELEVSAPGVQQFFLGARSDHFAPLRGDLAQFALFDRALTADEARQLHTLSGRPEGTPKALSAAAVFPGPQPLAPEESLKKLHRPPGYKAEIVVAEPLVLDPVAFDWDEQGRLWVVEMADYPLGMDGNGKPGGRVRVLTDADGDGRFEKSTLFAEGLNFPNGILTWRDGVIITAAPNVLFLQDTDGDGRADKQEVLVSGLQEGNQQLRANGLRWGLDNWVYLAIGGHHGKYGVDTRLKSLRSGQEILVGARDFRFRPDTGEIEPQTGPTQFGRNRDNWGRWFGTQNANPLWHYVLADQYLRRNPHYGAAQTLVQLITPPSPPVYPASPPEKRFHSFAQAGHYTSACAGMIYRDEVMFGATGSHAFICEPFHNLVQHVVLKDKGVTFSAEQVPGEGKFDFFASEDRWCRPVMVREGPDGALWIADMYRYMIEHPQFLTLEGKEELMPHYRLGDDKGRIYRVSRDEMAGYKPVRFDKMQTEDVVSMLNSTNGWMRDKAHQVLLWRADKAAVGPLLRLASHCDHALTRLHALCVLDGLGALAPEVVVKALGDEHPGVRENALRLAETRPTPEVLTAVVKLLNDKDAKVRLQLALSLGEFKDPLAGETLARVLVAHADDPMMVAAVMTSAVPHVRALVSAVAKKPDSALVDTLLTIALGLNDRDAVVPLLRPVFTAQDGRYTPEQVASFARLIDQLAQRNSTLEQLQSASPGDALGSLLAQSVAIMAQARSTAADTKASPLERIAAIAVMGRDPSARAGVLEMLAAWLDPKHPAEVQIAAIKSLTSIAAPEVPEVFAKAWPTMSPATRQVAAEAWMSREPWAFELARKLERKEMPASALDTTQRARLIKHDSPRVSQAAGKAFAASISARSKVVESFRPALSLKGDAVQGKQIYTLVCATCHKRGAEGRDLGPDLLTVVEHAPEKLLGSILDPSADIQPGFNSYTCTLNTGEQIYGLLASESANNVVMKLADGTQKTVLRNQIKLLRSQNLSLMPEGLEAVISPQQMMDLITYLRTPVQGGK